MKIINKSNVMELIGMEVINIKNEEVGTVVRKLDGKYTVNVNGEEKTYSLSELKKDWRIKEETENEGIIDNTKKTERRVKITGYLYDVPVKFNKINQTTIWKTLNRLYENRENTEDKYSLEDKKHLLKQIQELDEEVFAKAFRCLKSKVKQNYIEELMK